MFFCNNEIHSRHITLFVNIILHFIFNHSFNSGKLNADLWDLSCDIAVENMIMEMEVPAMALSDDDERRLKLKGLKKGVDFMSAERIYRYFKYCNEYVCFRC